MEFSGDLTGKKAVVIGLGKSGVSTAKYLLEKGAIVTVTDQKNKTELIDEVTNLTEFGKDKITFDLGKHSPEIFAGIDFVVLSPGVPANIPALDQVKSKNIPIINDVEIAGQIMREPIIGITGTNGKTTCTILTGELLKASGKNPFVCGNVGTPVLNYRENAGYTSIVCELSSFQLESIDKFTPKIAMFTNLDPDHLDRYPSADDYYKAKKRMLKNMNENTFVIINMEDPHLMSWVPSIKGKVLYFTTKDPIATNPAMAEKFEGAYLKGSKMIVKLNGFEYTLQLAAMKMVGLHNRQNLMCSTLAAMLMGAKQDAVQKVIDTFKGVTHRCEYVKKLGNVFVYNDSKATNVGAVITSLKAFPYKPIILIMGGRDKDQDFAPLIPYIQKSVKNLILIGEAKEKINRILGDYTETFILGTFEEAVLVAYQKSRNGDIILLAPGCASYDMFKNFEERGEYFKQLVNQL